MKTVFIAAVFICIYTLQAGAADSNINPQGACENIELKRAEILQHIQERITNSQAEITCVKAAVSHEEFKACHEKYRPVPKNNKRILIPPQ